MANGFAKNNNDNNKDIQKFQNRNDWRQLVRRATAA